MVTSAGVAGRALSCTFITKIESYEIQAFAFHVMTVLRAGHARFACEVSDAVGSPAAGTHRSDSGAAQCRP